MSIKFLENIATADIAFEIKEKTLVKLFKSAAFALEESMVDTKTVSPKIKKEFTIETDKLDYLLYNFLSKLIYYKDAEGLVFSKINLKISKKYKLHAKLKGEKIDINKHELRSDVKAVTFHMFEIKKEKNFWYCRVILDI
ncbi:MAG: archease [Nitrososphaerota archaeon]|nr:archease [Candidatus Aenigmarchaeota archaeon]